MPIRRKVKGSTIVKRKTRKPLLPMHGYNTEEGSLPATDKQIEKLESIALSRWTTEENRDIVKTLLKAMFITRATARETIMNCKSDWEINLDIERAKNGNSSG